MGIKYINKYLKDNFEHIFRIVPLKKFRGLRLGIDISIFTYKYMSPAIDQALNASNLIDDGLNEEMITEIFSSSIGNFIIKLMNNGIIPVFVFDGKSHPLKDQYAKKDRAEKRDLAQQELNQVLNDLKNMDPLLRDINMYSKLKKLYKQTYRPKSEHYKFLKKFLKQIGIKYYQAKTEADEVLGYLSRNGIVDVIYSDDSDQYAHGCPYIIRQLNKDYRSDEGQSVTMVCLEDILSNMKMNMDEFRDLCILLGCDYNKNIKGVGMVGSLKAINQYRSVPNLPSKYDKSSLNYPDCLSIFSDKGKELVDVVSIDSDDSNNLYIDFDIINSQETEKFMNEHGLIEILTQLKFFYDAFSSMDDYTDINPHFDRIKEEKRDILKDISNNMVASTPPNNHNQRNNVIINTNNVIKLPNNINIGKIRMNLQNFKLP